MLGRRSMVNRQLGRELLYGKAPHQEFEGFTLACRQSLEPQGDFRICRSAASPCRIFIDRLANPFHKTPAVGRFLEEIEGPRLERPRATGDVAVAGQHDHGQLAREGIQPVLQLQSADLRHANIQDQAARAAPDRRRPENSQATDSPQREAWPIRSASTSN